MSSIIIRDHFSDFTAKFRRKHKLSFFEMTQSCVESFCQDYLDKGLSHDLHFQTKANILKEYQGEGKGSVLSTKNTLIGKPKQKSSTRKNSSSSHLNSIQISREMSGFSLRKLSLGARSKTFSKLKANFLYNFSDKLDKYYNLDYLRHLHIKLEKKLLKHPEMSAFDFPSKP